MSDKVQKFLTTVMSHFNKRHASQEDEDAWTLSMINGLKGYDASVLDRAAERILLNRNEPGFPYLAECRKACEEVIKLERADRTPKFDDAAKAKAQLDAADWQYRLADDLIMCSLGKRAAQEGWILSLHDFARINGRIPTQEWEIRKCITSARGFDEAYEDLLRERANGRSSGLQNSLIHLGDEMLKRREKYRQMVLGRAAA